MTGLAKAVSLLTRRLRRRPWWQLPVQVRPLLLLLLRLKLQSQQRLPLLQLQPTQQRTRRRARRIPLLARADGRRTAPVPLNRLTRW